MSIQKFIQYAEAYQLLQIFQQDFRLKVATWDRPMAVEVLDPRTTQVSFWYNYRMDDGLVREEIKKSAGIAYGTYGKGRFMWMGFELNSIIGVQEDYILFRDVYLIILLNG